MTTLIDAAKQALEALLRSSPAEQRNVAKENACIRQHSEAINALRTAIQEAEQQEPVATIITSNGVAQILTGSNAPPIGTKLYTQPPAAKEWQGLTDVERACIQLDALNKGLTPLEFMELTEAKLKEKNA